MTVCNVVLDGERVLIGTDGVRVIAAHRGRPSKTVQARKVWWVWLGPVVVTGRGSYGFLLAGAWAIRAWPVLLWLPARVQARVLTWLYRLFALVTHAPRDLDKCEFVIAGFHPVRGKPFLREFRQATRAEGFHAEPDWPTFLSPWD